MNTYKGIQYKRINNDINGNPRYLIHYIDFLDKSELYSEKIIQPLKTVPTQ